MRTLFTCSNIIAQYHETYHDDMDKYNINLYTDGYESQRENSKS